MTIKFFITAILIIIGMATMFSTCKKSGGLGCPNSTYAFEINAKVFPDNDTINIGDTVWVEINSSNVFTDQNSQQQITFKNPDNMSSDFGLVELINENPTEVEGAIKKFKIKLVSGSFIPNRNPESEDTIIRNYNITETNGRYLFKMSLIPQDTGTYSINFGNFIGVTMHRESCPKADFMTNITQTNQHYYLFPGGSALPPGGPDYDFYVK